MNRRDFQKATGGIVPDLPQDIDRQMPQVLARLLNDPDFRLFVARLFQQHEHITDSLPRHLEQGSHAAATHEAGRAKQLQLLISEIADAPRIGNNLAALNR